MQNISIIPAKNGFIVSDGQQLLIATTLQEALQLIVSALNHEATVFLAFSKSDLSH